MTSSLQPFGLKPILHPSGEANIERKEGNIASAYGTQINQYQPILLSSGYVVPVSATTDQCIGTFLGCLYTPLGGRPTYSNYWPANTTLQTGTLAVAYYTDDPNITYAIQATGSIAQSTQGKGLFFSNLSATNGLQYSAATVGTTTATAGASGQVQVVDRGLGVDNDWGDTYTIVRVKLSNSQFQAATPSI